MDLRGLEPLINIGDACDIHTYSNGDRMIPAESRYTDALGSPYFNMSNQLFHRNEERIYVKR